MPRVFHWLVVLGLLITSIGFAQTPQSEADAIRCAALIYGHGDRVKVTICFSEAFLTLASEETDLDVFPELTQIRSESPKLTDYPFAVLAGEGLWAFTEAQRDNVQQYLENGGFILASAGCGSKQWAKIFRDEMKKIFPDHKLTQLPANHPVYDQVYDLKSAEFSDGDTPLPELWGLTIDGRTAMIFSPHGLNDTDNAGPSCCCCGGMDEKYAKFINVNILAYAMEQ